jgi:hypothetical protein
VVLKKIGEIESPQLAARRIALQRLIRKAETISTILNSVRSSADDAQRELGNLARALQKMETLEREADGPEATYELEKPE